MSLKPYKICAHWIGPYLWMFLKKKPFIGFFPGSPMPLSGPFVIDVSHVTCAIVALTRDYFMRSAKLATSIFEQQNPKSVVFISVE